MYLTDYPSSLTAKRILNNVNKKHHFSAVEEGNDLLHCALHGKDLLDS